MYKIKNNMISPYPNATRILQPTDVTAFQPLKVRWKRGVCEWKNENPNIMVTRKNFAPILERNKNGVINDTVMSDVLKNRFKACDLYP